MLANSDFLYFLSFIFKENHVLVEEENPSEKIVIVKEELELDIDDILVILKYLLMVESLLEILTERKNQTFSRLIDVHPVKNVLGESICSISMRIIVSQ